MNHKFCLHPSLAETINEASSAAKTKCELHFGQSMVLGVTAAAYLAMATTLAIALGATIQSPSVQKLVMGAVFPVGLIAVVVAVSELSTGNYLSAPLGAMTTTISWRSVLFNWTASYAGNFLGAFLLAVIIIHGAHVLTGAMWGQAWVNFLKKIVETKGHLSPVEAFWRGFLCIWLVDLAVWQSYRVKDYTAKFLLIFFPTFAFFALSLEHSVVNMFLFPAAIFAGASVSWREFLANNLVPVVLGNAVGGTFIVGMFYWFSAGLPVKNRVGRPSAFSDPGNHLNARQEQGTTTILVMNIVKALIVIILFVGLMPAGAAVLALVLPESLGIIIPMLVIIYLSVLAYLFSIWPNVPSESGEANDKLAE